MELTTFTKNMQVMMPQWMKMAKDPNSVGAQFLNVFGIEFKELEDYMESLINNKYIGTAELSQLDIVYKVPLAKSQLLDMEDFFTISYNKDNQDYTVFACETVRQFYLQEEDFTNRAIVDREIGFLYLKIDKEFRDNAENIEKPFDFLEINGTHHYEYSLHHIWNTFDEFGMLLGLYRHHAERNEEFKERILDVFRNPGNSTRQGLINGVSRELGLLKEDVTVNELNNAAFKNSMLDEYGRPSKKMRSYIDKMNKVFGFTWDNMAWGEAFWKSIEEENLGLDYLPHVWDAPLDAWLDTDFQSGVGSETDLYISAPKNESNIREFKTYVGLRGTEDREELSDPEISFKYKIQAKGIILNEEYEPEEFKYTVIAGEIIPISLIIRAYQRFLYSNVIDFNPETSGYEIDADNNVEIIKGTDNLSKTDDTNNWYRLYAELTTGDRTVTPRLESITVKWKAKNSNTVQNFTLTSLEELQMNDPGFIYTQLVDVFVTDDGAIELIFGDFDYMIDTEGAFKKGSKSNSVDWDARDGRISLNIPDELKL